MTRTLRFVSGAAAMVAAGVALTTGSTASNTMPSSSIAGFGTVAVSGATVSSIAYTLNTLGTTITGAVVTFSADQTGKTVTIGFNGAAQSSCTVTTTTASCASLSQTVATATSVEVSVHS